MHTRLYRYDAPVVIVVSVIYYEDFTMLSLDVTEFRVLAKSEIIDYRPRRCYGPSICII